MRVMLVGQAPSRQGDGTAFSGPSGIRLARLLGVADLAAVREIFELDNLILTPQHREEWKGDTFDRRLAQRGVHRIMSDPPDILIMCGVQVRAAFGLADLPFFKGRRRGLTEFWAFPHPSGISHFWNYPANVEAAQRFLKQMAVRARHNHPSHSMPLDQTAP